MIIEMSRHVALIVGEASKTIAFAIHSVDRSLFGRLILNNREKDFPPTAWLRANFWTSG